MQQEAILERQKILFSDIQESVAAVTGIGLYIYFGLTKKMGLMIKINDFMTMISCTKNK